MNKTETGDRGRLDHSEVRQARLSFQNGRLAIREPGQDHQSDESRRRELIAVATETKKELQKLLNSGFNLQESYRFDEHWAGRLDSSFCPKLPPTKVRVIDADTIDTAIHRLTASSKPVCILNMANARSAGGGWINGALAQEEALCYRTSLSVTLRYRHYPLPDKGGIYSPGVLVIRDSMKDGHGLLSLRDPGRLEIVSVISVAAPCRPDLEIDVRGRDSYLYARDMILMAEKMRLILRVAIRNKHKQLVLGAFGCGAFRNPREQVADMWASVLMEREFSGGWWQDVLFAVMDGGVGNFHVFHNALDGLMI